MGRLSQKELISRRIQELFQKSKISIEYLSNISMLEIFYLKEILSGNVADKELNILKRVEEILKEQ